MTIENFLTDDAGEISVLFCDICDFDEVIKECQSTVVEIMDEVFRSFDSFCDQLGIQKIETVGKTYMAAGGLKFVENENSQTSLEKHFMLRTVQLAKNMLEFTKKYSYRAGKHLKAKIGIHYGGCIYGVLGYHKPQFSLIGSTINMTSRVCTTGNPETIILSKEAYTKVREIETAIRAGLKKKREGYAGLQFEKETVFMKGIGMSEVFVIGGKGGAKNANNGNARKNSVTFGDGFSPLDPRLMANQKTLVDSRKKSMKRISFLPSAVNANAENGGNKLMLPMFDENGSERFIIMNKNPSQASLNDGGTQEDQAKNLDSNKLSIPIPIEYDMRSPRVGVRSGDFGTRITPGGEPPRTRNTPKTKKHRDIERNALTIPPFVPTEADKSSPQKLSDTAATNQKPPIKNVYSINIKTTDAAPQDAISQEIHPGSKSSMDDPLDSARGLLSTARDTNGILDSKPPEEPSKPGNIKQDSNTVPRINSPNQKSKRSPSSFSIGGTRQPRASIRGGLFQARLSALEGDVEERELEEGEEGYVDDGEGSSDNEGEYDDIDFPLLARLNPQLQPPVSWSNKLEEEFRKKNINRNYNQVNLSLCLLILDSICAEFYFYFDTNISNSTATFRIIHYLAILAYIVVLLMKSNVESLYIFKTVIYLVIFLRTVADFASIYLERASLSSFE